jgi:hypothetical protein
MLERQYDSPAAVERVRSSVLGIHADALTQFLVSRGHARYTINVYLNALEHLGLIFRAQGLPLAIATERDAKAAVRAHSVCHCSGPRSSRRLMTAAIPHLSACCSSAGRRALRAAATTKHSFPTSTQECTASVRIDEERVIRAATVFAVATSTFATNETTIIARLSFPSSAWT